MAITINRGIAKYALAFLAANDNGEAKLEAAWATGKEQVEALEKAWDEQHPEQDGWTTYLDCKEIKNGN